MFQQALLQNPNVKGIPTDYAKFEAVFNDETKAGQLYEALKANPAIKGLPDDFNKFYGSMGLKKKVGTEGLPSEVQSTSGNQPLQINDILGKFSTKEIQTAEERKQKLLTPPLQTGIDQVFPNKELNQQELTDATKFKLPDEYEQNQKRIDRIKQKGIDEQNKEIESIRVDLSSEFRDNFTNKTDRELAEIKKQYRERGYSDESVDIAFGEKESADINILRDNQLTADYRDEILRLTNQGFNGNLGEQARLNISTKVMAEGVNALTKEDKEVYDANLTIEELSKKGDLSPQDLEKYNQAEMVRQRAGIKKPFYDFKSGIELTEEDAKKSNPETIISRQEIDNYKSVLGGLNLNDLQKAYLNTMSEVKALEKLTVESPEIGFMGTPEYILQTATPGQRSAMQFGGSLPQEFIYNEKGQKYMSLLRDAKARGKALSEIMFLNKDLTDVKKGIQYHLGAALRPAVDVMLGEKFLSDLEDRSPKFLNDRKMLDVVQQLESRGDVQLTEEQSKMLERNFTEKVSELAGGILGIMPEFAGLSIYQKAAFGATLESLAKSSNRFGKLMGKYLLPMALEEAKFEATGAMPGMGAGMAAGGLMIPQIYLGSSPIAKILGGYVNTLRSGVGGTVGMELGANVEQAIEAVRESKDFKEAISNSGFGNITERGEEVLAELMVNTMFGFLHLKDNKKAYDYRVRYENNVKYLIDSGIITKEEASGLQKNIESLKVYEDKLKEEADKLFEQPKEKKDEKQVQGKAAEEVVKPKEDFMLAEENQPALKEVEAIETKITNAEYINKAEIESAQNKLLELSEKTNDTNVQKALNETFDKLENYELTTETTTRTVTETEPIEVRKKAPRVKVKPVEERLSGKEVVLEGGNRGTVEIVERPDGKKYAVLKSPEVKPESKTQESKPVEYKQVVDENGKISYEEIRDVVGKVEKETGKVESETSGLIGEIQKINLEEGTVNYDAKGNAASITLKTESGKQFTIRDKALAEEVLLEKTRREELSKDQFDTVMREVEKEVKEETLVEGKKGVEDTKTFVERVNQAREKDIKAEKEVLAKEAEAKAAEEKKLKDIEDTKELTRDDTDVVSDLIRTGNQQSFTIGERQVSKKDALNIAKTYQEALKVPEEKRTEPTKKLIAEVESLIKDYAERTSSKEPKATVGEDGSLINQNMGVINQTKLPDKPETEGLRPMGNALIGSHNLPVSPSPITGGKVKTWGDILDQAAKDFNSTMTFGKRSIKNALGTFSRKSKAVVGGVRNDLRIFSHELGHLLNDRYEIENKVDKLAEKEFLDLSKTSGTPNSVSEGIAEYVAGYMLNPEFMAQTYPNATKVLFENLSKRDANGMISMSNQIRSNIGSMLDWTAPGTNTRRDMPVRPLSQKIAEVFSRGESWRATPWDKVVEDFSNNLRVPEQAFKTLVKRAGLQMSEVYGKSDFAKLARLLYGHDKKVFQLWENGLKDVNDSYFNDKGEKINVKYIYTPAKEFAEKHGKKEYGPALINWMYKVGQAKRTIEVVDKLTIDQIKSDLKKNLLPDDATMQKYMSKIGNDVIDTKTVTINKQKYKVDVTVNERVAELIGNNKTPQAKERYDFTSNTITGEGGGYYRDFDIATDILDIHTRDKSSVDPMNKDKHKAIEEMLNRYENFADMVMQYAVQKGRISQENYDRIKETNENYFALLRILDDTYKPGSDMGEYIQGNAKTRLKTPETLIRNVKGSGAEMIDPVIALVESASRWIKEADRNMALKAFADMADKTTMGSADIIYKTVPGDKNSIVVYDKGTASHYRITDDYLYKALDDAFKKPYGDLFLKLLSAPTQLLQKSVTTYPIFALRNFIRDMQHRMFFSATPDALKSLKDWTDINAAVKDIYASGGGLFGYQMNRDTYYEMSKEVMLDMMKDQKNHIVSKEKVGVLLRKYIRTLEYSEAITRTLEYKGVYKDMVDRGMSKEDAMIEAAFAARDLMDFSVRGKGVTIAYLSAIAPFLNPRIQGIRKAFNSAKADPLKVAWRFGVYALMPEIMQSAIIANSDEETKKEFLDFSIYRRDLNWNFPLGDGHWLVIPKPFEMGVLSSTMGRMLDAAVLKDTNAYPKGYRSHLIMNMAPVDPGLFSDSPSPLVQSIRNWDSFRDKNIIPFYEKNIDVEDRNTKTASRLGQVIQEATSVFGNAGTVDARMADFLIKGYLTYYGDLITKASDIGRTDEDRRTSFDISMVGFVKESTFHGETIQNLQNIVKKNNLTRDKRYQFFVQLTRAYYKEEDESKKKKMREDILEYAEQLTEFYTVLAKHKKEKRKQAKESR